MEIVTKYQCNLCAKIVSKRTAASSFAVINKCIATANCSGNMFLLTEQSNEAVDFTDLTWSPRKALYTHHQLYSSNRWAVKHNLGVEPAVVVYSDDGQGNLTEISNFTIENSVVGKGFELVLDRTLAGYCQCIARESFRESATAAIVPVIDTTITSDSVLTMGVVHPEQFIVFKIQTFNPNTQQFAVRYLRGETFNTSQTAFYLTQKAHSAWSDVSYVNINRRNYKIALFNVFDDLQDVVDYSGIDFLGVYYTNTDIIEYTDTQLAAFIYQTINENECEILLSSDPHTTIDKITNEMIDVVDVNRNNLSIVNNDLLVSPTAITEIALGILF